MIRLIILSFTILTLLALTIGCSDDEDNPTASTPGPLDSMFVSELFNEGVFSTDFESLDLSWKLLEATVPGVDSRNALRQQSTSDDDEIVISSVSSYVYENGWHIFEFEAVVYDEDLLDTIDISGSDSIKVLNLGIPQQNPDSEIVIDEMRVRVHVDFATRIENNYGQMHHRLDADLPANGFNNLSSLNGTINDVLHGNSTSDAITCETHITLDEVITGLVIDLKAPEGDCPEAGTIAVTAGLDIDCHSENDNADSLSISGTWVVTAVANGDNTITVTFTSGLMSFTVTESCDNSAARQPIWNRMNQ